MQALFDANTAPDRVSRALLQAPAPSVAGRSAARSFVAGIHGNFSSVIDRNLAVLSPARAGQLITALTDSELSALAQLYVNSMAINGRPALGLDVLAHRLEVGQLVRLASFFGYAEVRSAVQRVAPGKDAGFARRASASFVSPVAGATVDYRRSAAGPQPV